MVIIVVTLHVIVCLFLIAVILLQAGRGQGLSWGVFGGTPQSILGTKTASFLSRVTTGCAIIFLFTCIILNIIETHKSRTLMGPQKRISQVDIAKIKEALEKAEQNKKANPVAETAAVKETVPNAVAQTQAPPAPPLTLQAQTEPTAPPQDVPKPKS